MTNEEKELIDGLFLDCVYSHLHPGWKNRNDILHSGSPCFLSDSQLFTLQVFSDHKYWIHEYLSKERPSIPSFIEAICEIEKQAQCLYAISEYGWFSYLLEAAGFREITRLVSFSHLALFMEPPIGSIVPFTDDRINEAYSRCECAFPPLWRLDRAEFHEAVLTAQKRLIYKKNGTIYGYLLADADFDYVHISRMAVSPDSQRSGIGKALMASIVSEYDQSGFTAFSVNTAASLESAVSFYENLGFIREEEGLPVFRKG